MKIPVLRTERLVLRPFVEADLEPLFKIQTDPDVLRYLGDGSGVKVQRSLAEVWTGMAVALGQWALKGHGVWAIEEAASGEMIGRTGVLNLPGWPEPELVWQLARRAWGKGLAAEATRAARDWAFGNYPWPRLVSFIREENIPSARLAERLGAVNEGRYQLLGMPCQIWAHPRPGRGAMA